MPARRILSVWLPHLGAERLLRRLAETGDEAVEVPLAVVREAGPGQVLASLSAAAEAAGLMRGQPLCDALAICPDLLTRPHRPHAEADFLTTLLRWARQFSPWVAAEPPEGLMLDITGCAHLFGGEAAMLAQIVEAATGLGLTARCGLADTPGAAWALARHAGRRAVPARAGDAIAAEARATRARAAPRRPHRPASPAADTGEPADRIAPPGHTRSALAPLPVAALRLAPETVAALDRLGLRCIGDLAGQPRAPLTRRFGPDLLQRLDQALGVQPEPISPAASPPRFSVRLTLPEPIGLQDDILAALERLLPHLCRRLDRAGRGARRLCLQARRSDGSLAEVMLGLVEATTRAERLRPLLTMRAAALDPGFGIDVLRLEAVTTEPLRPATPPAPIRQGGDGAECDTGRSAAQNAALADLIGRVGARIGLEAITRRHPAESHIPENCTRVLAAAWSAPHGSSDGASWPAPPAPRPLTLWRPEPVVAPDTPTPPDRFRWLGQMHALTAAAGPERIAPEWWLDAPDWRSGVRDYWRVATDTGAALWLFYAHGGTMHGGWFCHGRFA